MNDFLRRHGNALPQVLLMGMATTGLISCGDDEGPVTTDGTIAIVTSTEGSDFNDEGYLWSINNSVGQPIGHQQTIWVEALEPGDYLVSLGGIPDNCEVPANDNPQEATVVPNDTTEVRFDITCGPPDNPGGPGGVP
jgi:hypothetical protein